MNEVTKIHLGRQSFVIAVDAHKLLRDYLAEIARQVGADAAGVIEEVELRVAELLAERGVTGEKVILTEDVTYVKEQLGAPSDFKDDDAADTGSKTAESGDATRRLFRDTDHAMLAGVASGLGAYFNIDPVIFRIVFAIGFVSGGWGIIAYIVLWLIMPEAKTASERLQMRGKPVTVDTLKEFVDRADVSGVAHRASNTLVTGTRLALRMLAMVVGVVVATIATGLLAGLSMAGVYTLLHHGHVIHGALTFPLGTTEGVAVAGGFGVLTGLLAFLLATGISMVRRKWVVPGWGVAAMASLALISAVICGAAAPDAVQNVRDRYNANHHLTTRKLPPFHSVRFMDGDAVVPVEYMGVDPDVPIVAKADGYGVTMRYINNVPVDQIKTTVRGDTLIVDSRGFKPGPNWDCDGLCIGNRDYFTLQIDTPDDMPLQPLDN